MEKIVVLGEGYLGSTFKQRGFVTLNKEQFNITTFTSDYYLSQRLDDYDVIINCIAKSNTRYCEENYKDALFSNAEVPGILSTWCNQNNRKFVHISTGCLYDRNDTPQLETDFLAAHCNYTLTKWIGEKNCNFSNDLIIRPRLLFDNSTRPVNLLNKLRRFDMLCDELDSVSSTDVVVSAIEALLQNGCVGVFNVACDGYISMHQIGMVMQQYKPIISIDEIRKTQGLHLVNNIMSLDKLKRYYKPPNIVNEIKRCLE